MKAYINTRLCERNNDYQFLEENPPLDWWKSYTVDNLLSKEENGTLIITSNGEKWQIYLSGLPSVRKDSSNTPIRYTLVLEGETKKDFDVPIKMLRAGIRTMERLSRRAAQESPINLDQHLSEVQLRAWYDGGNNQFQGDLAFAIAEVLRDVERPNDTGTEQVAGGWWGGIQSESCIQAWLKTADSLVMGSQGLAAYLNYADPEDMPAIVHQNVLCAILVQNGPSTPVIINQIKERNVAPHSPPSSSPFQETLLPDPVEPSPPPTSSKQGPNTLGFRPLSLMAAIFLGTLILFALWRFGSRSLIQDHQETFKEQGDTSPQ